MDGGRMPSYNSSKVSFLNVGIREELRGLTAFHDPAFLQYIPSVSVDQGRINILLHDDERHPFLLDGHQRFHYLLDHHRRKPQRELIDQQQLGPGHQGAADGAHLLFAPAQSADDLFFSSLQMGKEVKDFLKLFGVAPVSVLMIGAHHQVFSDRHSRKEPSAFGHQRNSKLYPFINRN